MSPWKKGLLGLVGVGVVGGLTSLLVLNRDNLENILSKQIDSYSHRKFYESEKPVVCLVQKKVYIPGDGELLPVGESEGGIRESMGPDEISPIYEREIPSRLVLEVLRFNTKTMQFDPNILIRVEVIDDPHGVWQKERILDRIHEGKTKIQFPEGNLYGGVLAARDSEQNWIYENTRQVIRSADRVSILGDYKEGDEKRITEIFRYYDSQIQK